jgi:uncharacterized protein (TIGR02680 family)
LTRPPSPSRERWQPQRLGLVDLFLYDEEEFAFRDGRLLLRGNNGTGKSKVLALTLPFLLDGDLSPHRVEPDADPGKRMEWNLLLGGQHPSPERLGYAWLEFGRMTDTGPAWCTIGCGLKAASNRGIVGHWYFVTDQRIGDELRLVDATRTPLTAERLEEAIGGRGNVFRRGRDYRRAIDEQLFGLGDARYGALIDLLIKIRAPQLSKRPDEGGLSAALTGALPPLDQAMIADVAEAFRSLEEDADELAAMVEARDAAERYLDTYRAYARMASRRRAAPLRQVQTTFDRVSRELADAETEHEQAQTARAQARDKLKELRDEQARLEARQKALDDDPAARSAQALRRAAEDADEAEGRHAEAASRVSMVEARIAQLRDRVTAAEQTKAEALAAVAGTQAAAEHHARGARIEPQFADAFSRAGREEIRARAESLTSRQTSAVQHVAGLIRTLERAQDTLAEARAVTEQLVSEQADVTDRRNEAQESLAATGVEYLRASRRHLEQTTELKLNDLASTMAAVETWLQTLSGANPLEQATADAGREVVRRIAREREAERARAEQAQATISELEDEIHKLEAGVHPTPPAPHTRAATAREDRPGAPLWQLVDFRPELSTADRAGIEAALEAAGILDAWITPSGELLDPDTEDAVLAADSSAPTGPRLTDALVSAIDPVSDVTDAVVTGLLSSIGLGESDGTVWVSGHGRFRNGVLHGAWHKPSAAYIGHAARERARQARLAELRLVIQQARDELADTERLIDGLDQRHEQLERELADLPPVASVREAHSALRTVESELVGAERRLAGARGREREAQDREQAARTTLDADAADLGLPSDAEDVARVEDALAQLRAALAGLWPAMTQCDQAAAAHAQTAQDLHNATGERADAAGRLAEAELQLRTAVERRDTLQETAGAAIAELERRLAEVAASMVANTGNQRRTEDSLLEVQEVVGASAAKATELRRQLAAVTDERVSAAEQLRRFATTALIDVALPELEHPDPAEAWTVTTALRLARDIEQALAGDAEDEARWLRFERRTMDELGQLADALRRHGNNASAAVREGGIVVQVVFRAHATGLPELAAALADEVVERERLLDSREREILENHLVGEVASTLQELITGAERRVSETNRELAERPTSTGMRLRLRWIPGADGPDGLADARARLLRQTSDAWSQDDRAAVGSFLQNQIKAIRAQDAAGNWVEQLTQALDYRRWHRFAVERWQGGSWRSASGPASGGERVLAASLPLFAAASSYYSSAGNRHAPRLVMLDEAFAGVDDRARAQCLGLLSAFDLDVVMTSEREWGCYAEVPGLAIAQLSRIEGIAAVLVSRWEWDGSARMRVEPAAYKAATANAGVGPDGPQLWDTSTSSD